MFSMASILAFIGPGGPELLVIMLVLLMVFGAKDAPRVFRKINEFMNQLRSTADSFKREIMYSDLDVSSSPTTNYEEDESYDHDDDYTYDDECDDMADEEPDYSDETFQHLEADLEKFESEPAEKSAAAPTADESVVADDVPDAGGDDVQKA